MRAAVLLTLVFCAGAAHGAVIRVPLASSLVLRPNEAHTITVEAAEPVEIGWQAIQAKRCTTDCVRATDLTSSIKSSVATALGASLKYKPVGGKISIEYKNVSSEPVTINVYKVQRTCDAEACKFLDTTQKGRWLVFKVDEFKSIVTSKDGSYSVISGIAMSGRPFTVRAVWWTEDRTAVGVRCSTFITRYLDSHAPKEQYRPYVISGQAVGEPASIVLRSVDSCAPKAPNFGVPEKNVFK